MSACMYINEETQQVRLWRPDWWRHYGKCSRGNCAKAGIHVGDYIKWLLQHMRKQGLCAQIGPGPVWGAGRHNRCNSVVVIPEDTQQWHRFYDECIERYRAQLDTIDPAKCPKMRVLCYNNVRRLIIPRDPVSLVKVKLKEQFVNIVKELDDTGEFSRDVEKHNRKLSTVYTGKRYQQVREQIVSKRCKRAWSPLKSIKKDLLHTAMQQMSTQTGMQVAEIDICSSWPSALLRKPVDLLAECGGEQWIKNGVKSERLIYKAMFSKEPVQSMVDQSVTLGVAQVRVLDAVTNLCKRLRARARMVDDVYGAGAVIKTVCEREWNAIDQLTRHCEKCGFTVLTDRHDSVIICGNGDLDACISQWNSVEKVMKVK